MNYSIYYIKLSSLLSNSRVRNLRINLYPTLFIKMTSLLLVNCEAPTHYPMVHFINQDKLLNGKLHCKLQLYTKLKTF